MLKLLRQQLRKIQNALVLQSKLRKDELLANTSLSRPMRILGASFPILAGFIVTYQVWSSADESTIRANSLVQTVENWNWEAAQYNLTFEGAANCEQSRCYEDLFPVNVKENASLPGADPVALKSWDLNTGRFVRYRTIIDREKIADASRATLYLPGIRAVRVYVYKGDRIVRNDLGNMPYFLDVGLKPGQSSYPLDILIEVDPRKKFQGFINKTLFVGSVLQVYRTHVKLSQTLFPRQAVVIFLLSIGALTFAFFIFLDHKRELFALGLTISLLGAAEAVRIGIIPFLSTPAFFTLFTLHITALAWYTGEILRLTIGAPKNIFFGGLSIVSIYWFSKLLSFASVAPYLPEQVVQMMKPMRLLLLYTVNTVPVFCGLLCFLLGFQLYRVSAERALQLLITAGGMVAYGIYLLAYDLQLPITDFINGLNETPVMIIVVSWIISALSSLGSLERRVQIAVADREQRLKLEHEIVLAQAVQESFISPGEQDDKNYEVVTVYKAVKKVGGDWVTWSKLGDQYRLGIIGDVVGKGVQAGLIVSACDSLLRNIYDTLDLTKNSPEDIVRFIVASLYNSVIAPHHQRAMTAVIVVADDNGNVTYTSLGHPPLIGVTKDTTRVISVRNSWLSPSFQVSGLKVENFTVNDGETIVGFTDGVCDGSRELRHFRNRVKGWHDRPLPSIAAEFEEVTPDYDDQTLLLFRKKSERQTLAS